MEMELRIKLSRTHDDEHTAHLLHNVVSASVILLPGQIARKVSNQVGS